MSFLENHVPEVLQQLGPRGLRLWQWLATPLLLLLSLAAGIALGRLTRFILVRLTRKTPVAWDDEVAGQTGAPLALAWAAATAWFFSPWLLLPDRTESTFGKILLTALFYAFFWFLYRVVKVTATLLEASPWAETHATVRAFLPLGSRIARIAVVGMAAVALLAQLGYPVASLIAGLGIGGLAVALAAKSTLENLFGAFALGTDQPFAIGDFIKVGDTQGDVEGIGLRSTRIRTLDRTLVSIPNGKLADAQIESFSARDRFRFGCTLGLVFGTTSVQLRSVLSGCEQVLRRQPNLWPDDVVVRFTAIGAHSLDIDVMAWFTTETYDEFRRVRQDVLIGFLEVIEASGSALAFPTRTIEMKK